MDHVSPWHQTNWDWRAAGNFIGGGTGAGLAICGAIAHAVGYPVAPIIWLVAAFCIVCGLGLVWLEIGRPWRFLHVFFNPQTSWMTRESLLAPPLLISLVATATFVLTDLGLLSGVLAAAFLYAQSRILMAAKGVPAWREPRIVPLIVVTGLAEGTGAFLLLWSVSHGSSFEIMALALSMIALRWMGWAAYRAHIYSERIPPGARMAFRRMERSFFVAGSLAPALMLLVGFAVPASAGIVSIGAALFMVAGGWLLKFTIVTRAAFNQGFAVAYMPARGAGPTGPAVSTRRSSDHG